MCSFLKKILENIQKLKFWFRNFEVTFRLSNLKAEIEEGYVYIDESFDTTFNIDINNFNGGGVIRPPIKNASVKSPIEERVKKDMRYPGEGIFSHTNNR